MNKSNLSEAEKLKPNQRIFLAKDLYEEGIQILFFKELVKNGENSKILAYDPLEDGSEDEIIEFLVTEHWFAELDEAKMFALVCIKQEAGRLFRLSRKIEAMI